MADDEFEVLVDRDIRDFDSGELAAVLRSGKVAPRWHKTLLTMQRSLDDQLALFNTRVKADQAAARLASDGRSVLELEAQAERKRASAIRFKFHLRERLREAKDVLHQMGQPLSVDRLIDQRNRALARVGLLEDAIRQHRTAFQVDGGRGSADKEMWSHIGPSVGSAEAGSFNNVDDGGAEYAPYRQY
jgi:hypothetical protein